MTLISPSQLLCHASLYFLSTDLYAALLSWGRSSLSSWSFTKSSNEGFSILPIFPFGLTSFNRRGRLERFHLKPRWEVAVPPEWPLVCQSWLCNKHCTGPAMPPLEGLLSKAGRKSKERGREMCKLHSKTITCFVSILFHDDPNLVAFMCHGV